MSGGGKLELEVEPEPSPDFAVARVRAVAALEELRGAVLAMRELVDPVESHHDDVAELLQISKRTQELAVEIRTGIESEGGAALSWLLQNAGGIREIQAGDLKYWGEKEKHTHCLDVGEAGMELAKIRLGQPLRSIADAGAEDEQYADMLEQEFWSATRDFFREVVSANGLKEGASRKILEGNAEETLRVAAASNPALVEPLKDEMAEQALERAVEAAREAAYLRHFEESWPDKLKGGEARTRLGVANMRFLYRRGGGAKKDFEEMERKRLAAGGDA